MHNGGCVEKETNYHFNCVIRLGKLPSVLFAQMMFFFRFFFPYSWNRQWHDRPLGSCDMNSPREKLGREVIKIPLGSKFALCEYEHCPFFHCGSASRASMKQNTSSVVGFIVVALYNTSATCHYCCSKEDFKVVQQTVGKKSFLEDNLLSRGK